MAIIHQDNRRSYFRIQPEIDKPVLIDINGDNFVDVLHATDISEGGIGITVPHEFIGCKIDKPVSMIITLPFPISRSVTIEGRINHITGRRFGVEYSSVESEKRKIIRQYISYRLRDRSFFTRLKFMLGMQ